MDTVHWVKIALNTGLTLFLAVALLMLQFSLKPFQSGFYCNDYSINMKYSPSTVNNEALLFVSLTVTFFCVFLSELVNKTNIKLNRVFIFSSKDSSSYKIKLFNQRVIEVKEYIANIYINYGFFIIGLLLNTIVTLIGKKTIGRLRPNFLDVCKPNKNPYSICGDVSQTGKTYLIPEIDFQCLEDDKAEVEESRLSFPSGHSSTSFYTAVFLICYLNHMWRQRSCSLVLHISQVFIITCAFCVVMTRVTDNKHHVTDVFAGSGLGALIGFITFYYLNQFYRTSDVEIKHRSRKLSNTREEEMRMSADKIV